LADLNFVSGVDTKLLYDAAGFGLEFDLGNGLHFASSDHALGEVGTLDLAGLVGSILVLPLEA